MIIMFEIEASRFGIVYFKMSNEYSYITLLLFLMALDIKYVYHEADMKVNGLHHHDQQNIAELLTYINK